MRIFLNTISTTNFTGKQRNNTPQIELYEEFRQGKRPVVAPYSDKSTERLDMLAKRYRKSPTIKNKRVLLNHERKMLYEELEHPELTLARNYSCIAPIIPQKTKPEVVDNIINNFNLTGLARIEKISKPFETRYTNKKMKLLDKVYNSADEKKRFGKEVQYNALAAIDGVNFQNKHKVPLEDEDYVKTFIDLYKELKEPDAMQGIMVFGKKENKAEITGVIEDALTSKDTHPQAKLYAIWGGGKFRNDKIFGLLKGIALDTESEIMPREFAIHSLALYLRERPQEVAGVMDKISDDGSVFEPLGKVLKERITGSYHNQLNREYKTLTKEEINAIDEFKRHHLFYDLKLNRRKQNIIDMDLINYKNLIVEGSYDFAPIAVIRDTYTRVFPNEAGNRHFNQGLKNSGCFADSVEGVHTPSAIILKNDLIADEGYISSVGHEMGHELACYLTEEQECQLNKLYETAIKEDRLLGDYAGRNVDEYFAVGCDSYCSVYKPHRNLLNGDYKNTRYTLMAKDPDLYKFIKNLLKK